MFDPACRYNDSNPHPLEIKIHRVLETCKISTEVFEKWKKEIDVYWIKKIGLDYLIKKQEKIMSLLNRRM